MLGSAEKYATLCQTCDWSIFWTNCSSFDCISMLIGQWNTYLACHWQGIYNSVCWSQQQLNPPDDQMTQSLFQFSPIFILNSSWTMAQFSTVANYFCAAVNLRSQFKIIDNASGVAVCSLSADAAPGIVRGPLSTVRRIPRPLFAFCCIVRFAVISCNLH